MSIGRLVKDEQLKTLKSVHEVEAFIASLKPHYWLRKKRPTRHSGKSMCALIYESYGKIHYMWDDGATSGCCRIMQMRSVLEVCDVDADFYDGNHGIIFEFKTGVI